MSTERDDRPSKSARKTAGRARQRKGTPWFREFDGWYYGTVNGKKFKLVRGEDNFKAAQDELTRLRQMGEADAQGSRNPCWVIFERFLAHTELHNPGRMREYTFVLQSFKDVHPNLPVAQLRAHHVEEWIRQHPTWGESTRGRHITVLQAALNWAVRPANALLESNPIARIARPSIRSRGKDAVLSPEIKQVILDGATPKLREAIKFMAQTGIRPASFAHITAETVCQEYSCLRLEKHKTKRKTGQALIIPLTQAALEQCLALAQKYPTGPLFRNRSGKAWTAGTMYAALRKIAKRAGIQQKVYPYQFRHTVATELIQRNVPLIKVAALLGHKTTQILQHHYAHLDSAVKSLAQEIDQALNGTINASNALKGEGQQ